MDATNIINIGLLLVTAIGVFGAIYQAKEARAARNDAQASSESAADHERAALAAAQQSAAEAARSAAALEEANDIARQSLPRDPWNLVQHPKNKYELRNDSTETLWSVGLDEVSDQQDITPFVKLPIPQLHPGESIFFDYSKSFASPASTTVIVSWDLQNSTERQTWRRTLS